jgi:hypothetical protein
MNTDGSVKFDNVKNVIRKAFKDVTRSNGISLHEAEALDDHASAEDRAKARALDTEENWWDLPSRSNFVTGLIFTDHVNFLLPAAMSNGEGDAVHWVLCRPYDSTAPHHGHKEFISYLQSIDSRKIAAQYEFTDEQLHAIALFFKWWMQGSEAYLYEDPEKSAARFDRSYKAYHTLPKTHYDLTVADEKMFFEEECRVLRDWLTLGKVAV